MRRIIGKDIKLTMLTDSMSLFKVMVNSSITTEKRLMIDIAAARQAYERSDIYFIGWIPAQSNIANGLTKLGVCATLDEFLRTQTLTTETQTVINGSFETIPINSDEFLPSEQEDRECDEQSNSMSDAHDLRQDRTSTHETYRSSRGCSTSDYGPYESATPNPSTTVDGFVLSTLFTDGLIHEFPVGTNPS